MPPRAKSQRDSRSASGGGVTKPRAVVERKANGDIVYPIAFGGRSIRFIGYSKWVGRVRTKKTTYPIGYRMNVPIQGKEYIFCTTRVDPKVGGAPTFRIFRRGGSGIIDSDTPSGAYAALLAKIHGSKRSANGSRMYGFTDPTIRGLIEALPEAAQPVAAAAAQEPVADPDLQRGVVVSSYTDSPLKINTISYFRNNSGNTIEAGVFPTSVDGLGVFFVPVLGTEKPPLNERISALCGSSIYGDVLVLGDEVETEDGASKPRDLTPEAVEEILDRNLRMQAARG